MSPPATSSPSLAIRAAIVSDLGRVWEIRYANDIAGAPTIPERGAIPPYLTHLSGHGTLLVAEVDNRVVGYAGRVDRGGVAYLTDLFVDPERQSATIGGQLLGQIFADDPASRCTLASTDFRALALYTRAGMTPRWPNILLVGTANCLGELFGADIVMVAADVNDPELRRWDGAVSGRLRPQDLAFFTRSEEGHAFWFRRQDKTVGYGIIRLGAGRLWYADAVTLGPIGVMAAVDACHSVLAAVAWARERRTVIELAVPGPHPALATLLGAGFKIVDVETYCASDATLVDPARYIGSGGDLF